MFLSTVTPRRTATVTVAAALAAAVFAGLSACSVNPATGREDFAPLQGKDAQVALGVQAAPQFEQQGGGKLNNSIIQAYVERVGQKQAAAAQALFPKDASGFKYTYTVLNDSIVNAFALPGGAIYITKGILLKMNNEAQLAFVLGHETGHVVAQHVARQMTQNAILSGAVSAGGLFAGGSGGTAAQAAQAAAQVATQMYGLKYSRTDESQADTLGLKFMVAAGYNPVASIQVMQVLDSLGSQGPEWTSTHPAPKNRLQALQAQIQQQFPNAANDPHYVLDPEDYQRNVLSQHLAWNQLPRTVDEALAMNLKR